MGLIERLRGLLRAPSPKSDTHADAAASPAPVSPAPAVAAMPAAADTAADAAAEAAAAYQRRIEAEKAIFADQIDVHALPRIADYWANTWLRPRLESLGVSDPDSFFVAYLERAYREAASRPVRFISIGAGNSDTEVRLARRLVDLGCAQFTLECLELNPAMVERGIALAAEHSVSAQVKPVEGDFNFWRPDGRYDAVLANQSLHHVSDLEHLFDAIAAALTPQGRFITSDMIGRNGHQRWPEAAAIVREFWRELPPAYRYHMQLRRQEDEFLDWDCAQEGFEGIRAQDILPLLLERFEFEFFYGFANVIDPFIDRGFGHHFNVDAAEDRALIDRIQARDEAELLAGTVKPTHMLASMRIVPTQTLHWRHMTPAFCVRRPDAPVAAP